MARPRTAYALTAAALLTAAGLSAPTTAWAADLTVTTTDDTTTCSAVRMAQSRALRRLRARLAEDDG